MTYQEARVLALQIKAFACTARVAAMQADNAKGTRDWRAEDFFDEANQLERIANDILVQAVSFDNGSGS
jgi:hypothetical protein